ncbi:RHS repeat-associated core domain-containing protein [Allorhizocola rhizosphaerae]|uniref:RHS repeat-associated core domain-containing protein n=1 Tax=Allorhizocola rhizosphaerae TaxID=1872709 RepID=UPI000E3C9233|nr:RHS repeat-associated core domain-containing protein [Allorhizocola rhizosphaerae]
MSNHRRRLAAALAFLMTVTLVDILRPAVSAAAGPSTELEKTDPVPVTKQTMGSRAPDQASLQALTGNQPTGGQTKEGSGTPTASPLSPSASWKVSPQTGNFTWSYPLRVPPVPGGLEPELALNYSSSAVDGRTSATNNQASWAGDGWDLSVGFIERTYGGCSTDGHSTKGDLCWRSENAYAAFPGGSGQMAKDANGFWRLESDNGARIEHLPGDHWKITTVDGTQYFFGSRADAGSKWTVPVFGDDPGEPCHTGTFATSHCVQPWRWNLDRVVDTHGNQILYGYLTETDTYRRNEGETRAGYTRGGTLRTAEYGPADAGGRTTARVDFDTADRCVRDSVCTVERKENWPDSRAEADPESIAPTFWITKRLAKVTTSVLKDGQYRPVDSWTLEHQFPNPGDGQKAALWLRSITRAGHVGGETTLPPVVFEGTKMANRVHAPDAFAPLNRYRISGIVTETGGVVDIKYRAPDCTPENVGSIVRHENTKLCYAVKWKPQYSNERTDWFHKYVVDSVEELDRLGNTVPTSTRYVYHDGAAWHYDTSEFTEESKRTWSEYRGFGRVQVLTGRDGDASGPVTMKEHRYHRGMHGDTLPNGQTRTVTVDGRPDHDWLSGFEYYEATHLGVSDTIVSKTLTKPDWQGPTASRGRISAYILRDGEVRTQTHLGADRWRETKVVSSYDDRGILTETDDFGDVSTPADDRCTTVGYVRNSGDWILDRPVRNVTVAVNCDTTPVFPRDALSDTQTAYDGKDFGQPPSKGDATHVKSARQRPASGPVYQTMSTTTYDTYGRVTRSGDALGRETTTAYEPATGGPVTRTTTTNALGHNTIVTLEPAWGQPIRSVEPTGAVTETQYDPLGRTAQVWLPNRPRANNPEGSYRFTYEIHHDKTTVVTTSRVGPRGNHVTSHTLYDGLLRERQTQTPAVGGGRLIVDTHYDTHGRAYKTTNPYYNDAPVDRELWRALDTAVPGVTLNTYDGANRITSTELRVHDTVNQRTTRSYGGDRVTVTPPAGAPPTTTVNNARGQTVELIQAGESTKYGYSRAGLLASVTDPAGNSWTFGYDLLGNRVESDDLDKGDSTATFDAAGQLTSTTDARGITLTYHYDDLGRQTSIKRGSETLAEFTFDTAVNGAGLPAKSIRYHGGQAYVTEILGYSLLKQVTRAQTTIPENEQTLAGTYLNTFTFNPDGSLASESYPAIGDQTQPWGIKQEIVTHTYDDFGRPLKTYGGFPGKPVNYVLDNEFTRYGESTRLHLGEPPREGENGKRSWLTTYRELGTRRVERIIVDAEAPSPKQSDATFAYDPAGNITSIATALADGSVDRQCFRYDAQRRLTEAWTPAGQCASPSDALGGPAAYRHSFTYDAAGNRTTGTKNGTLTQYNYTGTGHRLASLTTPSTAGVQTAAFDYDAMGNTKALAGMTLEWDAEGHLAKAVKDGRVTTFVYAADGERLVRNDPDGVTLYLAGQELRLEKQSGARKATRYYTHGGQTVAVRADGRLTWLAADHQGTAQIAIDAETLQASKRFFDPFGGPRGPQAAFPGEQGFVGGTRDGSTGLTHLGARDYSPELGRFVSVDPLLLAADPQQLNGYAYAANTPVVMSDPTGLAGSCPDGVCNRNTCSACASNRQTSVVAAQQRQTATRKAWGPHYRSFQNEKAAQKYARTYLQQPVAKPPAPHGHHHSPHSPKAPKPSGKGGGWIGLALHALMLAIEHGKHGQIGDPQPGQMPDPRYDDEYFYAAGDEHGPMGSRRDDFDWDENNKIVPVGHSDKGKSVFYRFQPVKGPAGDHWALTGHVWRAKQKDLKALGVFNFNPDGKEFGGPQPYYHVSILPLSDGMSKSAFDKKFRKGVEWELVTVIPR